MSNSILESALYLATKKVRILPVKPRSKSGFLVAGIASGNDINAYDQASIDPVIIQAWWNKDPAANIALCMGEYEGVILVCIEYDVKEGKVGKESFDKLVDELGPLPATFTQKTPTGSIHFIFKCKKLFASKDGFRKDVDIKCHHGMVLGAESYHPKGGRYKILHDLPFADLPQSWEDVIAAYEEREQTPALDLDNINYPAALKRAESYLAHLKEELKPIDNTGADDKCYKIAAKMHDFHLNPYDALELMSSYFSRWEGVNWPDEEIKEKIDKAYRYAKGTPGNALPEIVFDKIAPSSTPLKYKFPLLTDTDCVVSRTNAWLVKTMLPLKGTGAIVGDSGAGKTFLEIAFACSIAGGTPFFDKKTKQGSVLIMAMEGTYGIKHRVRAYLSENNIPPGLPIFIAPFQDSFISKPETLKAFIKEMKLRVPDLKLVFIDTYARAMAGGNENDAKDTGAMVKAAQIIEQELDCFVCFIHHHGKDKDKGMRGHSSLHAALDTVLEVYVNKEGERTVKALKQKEGMNGELFKFKLKPVTLGVDEDLEPITSCVVVPDSYSEPMSLGDEGEQEPPAIEEKYHSGAYDAAVEMIRNLLTSGVNDKDAWEQVRVAHFSDKTPVQWRSKKNKIKTKLDL